MPVKVFISSVSQGFGAFREAAAEGVTVLGHHAIRAEDFGASPDSPQQACLAGVRDADLTLLILGARYGSAQESGRSPTHEEYREARDRQPVLVFVQQGVDLEPRQREFIREVEAWERGHFLKEFRDADELRSKVIRALHDYLLANAAGSVDEAELVQRARARVAAEHHTNEPEVIVAVAGGPRRAVLRPAELEQDDLRRFLLAEALTGVDAVLDPSWGTDVSIRGDAVNVVQKQGRSGRVTVTESADIVVAQPALDHHDWRSGILSLIEEVIQERIIRAIRFCSRALDRIDSAQRITHVAPVAGIHGAGYLPWRTRSEHEASPNQATMGTGRSDHVAVVLSPPIWRRAALLHDTQVLAEDLTVRLRRELRG